MIIIYNVHDYDGNLLLMMYLPKRQYKYTVSNFCLSLTQIFKL